MASHWLIAYAAVVAADAFLLARCMSATAAFTLARMKLQLLRTVLHWPIAYAIVAIADTFALARFIHSQRFHRCLCTDRLHAQPPLPLTPSCWPAAYLLLIPSRWPIVYAAASAADAFAFTRSGYTCSNCR